MGPGSRTTQDLDAPEATAFRGTDEDRLGILHGHGILDTAEEPSFDALVQMCSLSCRVPIALVSLVDRHRQWFKAKVGIDACETSREVSFCSVAIESPDRFLVVEDAARDPRFSDSALVTGEPHIRFYAGVPLLDGDGVPLGTVCIIDRKPRTFTTIQRGMLLAATAQATELLRLRASERRLIEATSDLVSHQDLMEHLVKVIGHDFRAPLHAIQHLAEWGIEAIGEGDHEELPDLFERIQGRASRAESMHGGLLELLRSDLSLIREEVDVREVLASVSALADDGVRLGVDYEGPDGLVSVPQLLSTILSNLVANSVRHRGERDAVNVRVAIADDGGHAILDYRDDGPGIPEKALDRVFMPFERLVARDEVEGTGLGLSLVRKAAGALGGDARAVAHGDGARFMIDLGPVVAVSGVAPSSRAA